MLFTVKNVFPCSSFSCCFFCILFYILIFATFSLHLDSLFVCFQSCLLLSGGNIEDWRCLLILVLNLTRIIFQRCKRKWWNSQITTKVTSILCITSTCFSCCCHPAWNCVRLNSSYAKETNRTGMLLPLWTTCITLTLLSDTLKWENNQRMCSTCMDSLHHLSSIFSSCGNIYCYVTLTSLYHLLTLLLISLLKMSHFLALGCISLVFSFISWIILLFLVNTRSNCWCPGQNYPCRRALDS